MTDFIIASRFSAKLCCVSDRCWVANWGEGTWARKHLGTKARGHVGTKARRHEGTKRLGAELCDLAFVRILCCLYFLSELTNHAMHCAAAVVIDS